MQQSTLSPMTTSLGDDSDKDDATVSTTESMDTADTTMNNLRREDAAERGDGGDSDEEGEGYFLKSHLKEVARDSALDQLMNDKREIEYGVTDVDDNGIECIAPKKQSTLSGAPEGWIEPGPPDDWSHQPDTARGEPPFSNVDNPGGWSPYCFTAKFSARGKRG